MTAGRKAGSKRTGPAELARALRGLEELTARGDRAQLEAERKANPLLLVTFCELSDKDMAFAAEPSRRKAGADATFKTALRCDAMAIARHSVRDQTVSRALQRLRRRAPIPSLGRYVYSSARARALLAWLEEQRPSAARDAILGPLRRAVTRKHAFSIVFDTV